VSAQSPRPGFSSGPRQSTRRRLHPDARRAELIESAIRVLRELGPEVCRVEDITDAAGTAKGNFYRYFPGWDDLLVAVRDHILDSYRAELAQRCAGISATNWWTVLDAEIERFVDFQLDLKGLHQVIFHGPASAARPSETHRSAASTVALFLAAGVAEGACTPLDVEATAPILFDLLHGAADRIAAGMDRERVLGAIRHIVHRTLEPGPDHLR
jgi:AcrR family transcriptional regulator